MNGIPMENCIESYYRSNLTKCLLNILILFPLHSLRLIHLFMTSHVCEWFLFMLLLDIDLFTLPHSLVWKPTSITLMVSIIIGSLQLCRSCNNSTVLNAGCLCHLKCQGISGRYCSVVKHNACKDLTHLFNSYFQLFICLINVLLCVWTVWKCITLDLHFNRIIVIF